MFNGLIWHFLALYR